MNKWLVTLFFISMAINLFVVGYFIGTRPNVSQPPLTTSLSTHDISGVFKNLTPENLAQIKTLMKKQQEEMIANQAQIIQIRLQIAQVLMQESLNQQLLSNLFEKTNQLTSRNISLAQQTLYQTLLQLPTNERIKIGRAMANTTQKTNTIKIPLKNLTQYFTKEQEI